MGNVCDPCLGKHHPPPEPQRSPSPGDPMAASLIGNEMDNLSGLRSVRPAPPPRQRFTFGHF